MHLCLRQCLFAIGALGLAAYVWIYSRQGAPLPIRSDGYSYYVYLPSWLIYRDVTLDSLARDWYGGDYPALTGIARWPDTGRWISRHPIGPAILMSPFFVGAHLLTRWSNLPPDGFSLYYQHADGLAGLCYLLAGLAVLARTLTCHFSPVVALATIVTVTFGTNLFHYGTYDSSFSHVYSFFLICVLVELTDRWWEAPTALRSCGIGFVSALIVLTRPVNALFLLLVPLYRLKELRQRSCQLAMVVSIASVAVLPQLLIYRQATGQWLVNPYRPLNNAFNFGSPRLLEVLFSTQKGLFFWSPALLMAIGGLFTPTRWSRAWAMPVAIVLTIDTYLIASWSDWQFGGSYGHRGFTDGLGLFAIFVASFFTWCAGRPRLVRFVAAGTSLAVALSVVQMAQYWIGVVPFADTTWAQYRALFLRFH